VEFRKVPTMVIVRKELSKARHQYFTFLSEEGCEYLKDYLESRIREGEVLGPDSPIITPKQRMKPFIRAVNIGDIIREAIRKAGYPWRPYVLRSYFDTQLMLAESKGLVLRDYRTFWMGHKGDIEARYTTNKQRLPEEVIEDMREAYRKSQDFLQTYTKATSISEEEKKEMVLSTLREVAKSYGIDPLKVRIELAQENPDFTVEDEIQAIQESIRKLFGKTGLAKQDPPAQKVIRPEELDSYLRQGWSYLSELRDGRIVVRKEA
ncbi:MAG: site-specific integrase, partial [Nitrososphaeria archaeon]